MFKIDVIACGRLRASPLLDLWMDYLKRMQWSVTLHEIDERHPEKMADKIVSSALLVALDERGKSLSSREFSTLLQTKMDQGMGHIQFLIGGADGLGDEIRDKAQSLLSFGKQTWPHMLARIMLIEQLYRAQQIMKGHPYHREG